MTTAWLPIVWFCIIGLEVVLYMLLDGTNLGVGLLSLLPQSDKRRLVLMHVFGPMWDANETWLLIAAATTYGAFPIVFSVALNALYIPAMTLGAGLILRVASYEFYAHTQRTKHLWATLFGIGSLLATIGLGLLLGGLLSGIRMTRGHFSGGPFDWATLVTFLITTGIVTGFVVLGYAHMVRQSKIVSKKGFERILLYSILTFALLASATAVVPNTNYLFLSRWSDPRYMPILWSVVGLIAASTALLVYAIHKRDTALVPWLCNTIFIIGFFGIVVGTFPYILPPNITIFDAASSPTTQTFMLWGIGPILPIVLVYNYYISRLFRDDDSYEI